MRAEMLRSAALLTLSPPSSCSLISDPAVFNLPRPRQQPRSRAVVCSGERSRSSIPKLEPFSRSRLERSIKDPPMLQKCEIELTDYCTTLDSDDSCSCWKAYFELKDLENEMPREDVERLVRQAGGMKSLISCLHGITAMEKNKDKSEQKPVVSNTGKEEGRRS